MIYLKSLRIITSLIVILLCKSACAGTPDCGEKGYIEQPNLIKITDIDCSDYEGDGLCSVLIDAPLKFGNRDFWVFTFKKAVGGKVETYLNLSHESVDSHARAGFDVSEKILPTIEITAVYQNINGCTVQSDLQLEKPKP